MVDIKVGASAYVDPGTGGMVLNSLWSYIAMFFAAIGAIVLKFFFSPIKERILKVWNLIKNMRH